MKICVGKYKKQRQGNAFPERIVFILGIILMCAVLIAPMSKAEDDPFVHEAVLVMSSVDKEEIMLPDDEATLSEKKWSFYDYIGELFANLIFGED